VASEVDQGALSLDDLIPVDTFTSASGKMATSQQEKRREWGAKMAQAE